MARGNESRIRCVVLPRSRCFVFLLTGGSTARVVDMKWLGKSRSHKPTELPKCRIELLGILAELPP